MELLSTKVTETVNKMQKVHTTILSVPTLLKIIQLVNADKTNQEIVTVEDLMARLSLSNKNRVS